jgi:hypothetical protein
MYETSNRYRLHNLTSELLKSAEYYVQENKQEQKRSKNKSQFI